MAGFLAFLAVVIAGMAQAPPYIAVPAGAVALLYISDRGQHRELAARSPHLPQIKILGLSIGASLMLALLFCALAYAGGRLLGWFWA